MQLQLYNTDILDNLIKKSLNDKSLDMKFFAATFLAKNFDLIKNNVRAAHKIAQRQKKTLLFLGRDTWIFYLLARRSNFKAVFDPRISRAVVDDYYDLYKQVEQLYPPEKYFLVDTGFAGSIPRILGYQQENTFCLMSSYYKNRQIFQNNKQAREIALNIEDLESFWESANLTQDQPNSKVKINQSWADLDVYSQAARLTKWIWTNCQPRQSVAKRQKERTKNHVFSE